MSNQDADWPDRNWVWTYLALLFSWLSMVADSNTGRSSNDSLLWNSVIEFQRDWMNHRGVFYGLELVLMPFANQYHILAAIFDCQYEQSRYIHCYGSQSCFYPPFSKNYPQYRAWICLVSGNRPLHPYNFYKKFSKKKKQWALLGLDYSYKIFSLSELRNSSSIL